MLHEQDPIVDFSDSDNMLSIDERILLHEEDPNYDVSVDGDMLSTAERILLHEQDPNNDLSHDDMLSTAERILLHEQEPSGEQNTDEHFAGGPVTTVMSREIGGLPPRQFKDACHPWGMLDFHLYLAVAESSQLHDRRNGMYYYDGDECCPIRSHELTDAQFFGAQALEGEPMLLIYKLPIPYSTDNGPDYRGREYVLGFDHKDQAFFARYFISIPNSLADIWKVWDEGVDVYRITPLGLVRALRDTLSGRQTVSVGVLSGTPHCESRHGYDPPGFELAIAVMLGQWTVDFADFALDNDDNAEEIVGELKDQLNKCRTILQRASYRAWFAHRDGVSSSDFSRMSIFERWVNDLYVLDESSDRNALESELPLIPTVEDCEQVIREIRALGVDQADRRLANLFNNESDPSHNAFRRPLGRAARRQPVPGAASSQDAEPLSPIPRRTHSVQHIESLVDAHHWGADSMGLGAPVEEDRDDFEVTEYHEISLHTMVTEIVNILETRPDVDSYDNRHRLGTLLGELGIPVGPVPATGNNDMVEIDSIMEPGSYLVGASYQSRRDSVSTR